MPKGEDWQRSGDVIQVHAQAVACTLGLPISLFLPNLRLQNGEGNQPESGSPGQIVSIRDIRPRTLPKASTQLREESICSKAELPMNGGNTGK